MTVRRLLGAVLVLGALLPGRAEANPMVARLLRVRQVPKTRHVQITVAYADGMPRRPVRARRDGVALAGVWRRLSQFMANNGSGLTGLRALQYCDCDLPPGRHLYRVSYRDDSWSERVNVVDPNAAPRRKPVPRGRRPGASPGLDLVAPFAAEPHELLRLRDPGMEPEPRRLQGLDCRKVCPPPRDLPSRPR